MKCWWWKGDGNNFGDIICPHIIHEITGEKVIYSTEKNTLISIGSVVSHSFNFRMKYWGSGAIDENTGNKFIHLNNYYAVRGPNTRRKIISSGGYCPEIYGDPALLLPIIFPKKTIQIKLKHGITVIPHWIDLDRVVDFECKNINLVDIRSNWWNVLQHIASSKIILTSSLHGLIVGEAYNIPTVFVKFSNKLCGGKYKFIDYYNSTDRELIFYDHKKNNKLDIDNCTRMLQHIKPPNINIKKFIKSFPGNIYNNNIIKFINV
jgi:pyruvyltransferase